MSKLDEALKDCIRQRAAERNGWLTDEQVEKALKGVRHWFDVTAVDSIDTALDEL